LRLAEEPSNCSGKKRSFGVGGKGASGIKERKEFVKTAGQQ